MKTIENGPQALTSADRSCQALPSADKRPPHHPIPHLTFPPAFPTPPPCAPRIWWFFICFAVHYILYVRTIENGSQALTHAVNRCQALTDAVKRCQALTSAGKR